MWLVVGYFEKKNIGEKPLSQSMSGIWLPYDTLPFIAILQDLLDSNNEKKNPYCFDNYALNHSNNWTEYFLLKVFGGR